MRSRRSISVALVSVLLAGSVTAVSPPVAAQSEQELERARSAYRQGLSLEAAGNWAAALAKFQEVARVKVTPQVRFHTARCYEQLGRLNEALGDYRLAEFEAGQQGLAELDSISQARQGVEARIPKLTIRRGKGTENARIVLDGVELGEAQLGQALAVDPGPHRIVAKLAADKEMEESVVLKETEAAEVVLDVPEAGAPATAAPAAAGADAAADVGAAPAPSRSVLPYVVGGVGVAGLIGAGVFYAIRSGAEGDLEDTCRGSTCPESMRDTQDKGELFTTLSLVSLGVGVVGLGVGTYLFVTDPAGREKASAGVRRVPHVPHVDVAVTPAGGALTVRGAF